MKWVRKSSDCSKFVFMHPWRSRWSNIHSILTPYPADRRHMALTWCCSHWPRPRICWPDRDPIDSIPVAVVRICTYTCEWVSGLLCLSKRMHSPWPARRLTFRRLKRWISTGHNCFSPSRLNTLTWYVTRTCYTASHTASLWQRNTKQGEPVISSWTLLAQWVSLFHKGWWKFCEDRPCWSLSGPFRYQRSPQPGTSATS